MVSMMENERRELAKRVRGFREKNLLTQKMVAEAARISLREIKYIEAGEANASYRVRRRLQALEARHDAGRTSWGRTLDDTNRNPAG